MTFRAAIEATPGLAGASQAGLQALAAADRPRVLPASTGELVGGVALDAALQAAQPNASRWDYGIGYGKKATKAYWAEVHPATDGEVAVVLAKLAWIRAWLGADGYRLAAFPATFAWIASGETTFTPSSPARRRLAQAGVIYAGRRLRLT